MRLYLYIATVVAFLGLGTFAGCEHKAANLARTERDTARDANRSNIVTIGTQTKALEQWKRLHKTPEEVAVIVTNANAYVTEIDRLTRQVKFYRGKDKSLPECVALLSASLSRICPGTAFSVRLRASGGVENGGSPGPSAKRDSLSAH